MQQPIYPFITYDGIGRLQEYLDACQRFYGRWTRSKWVGYGSWRYSCKQV